MEAAEEQAAAAPVAANCEPAETSAMEECSAEAVEVAAADEDAAAAAAAAAAEAYSWPQLRFDLPPRRLYHFADQFRSPRSSSAGNFLKGAKWSPDGSSFLTSSDDNSLRMFCLYYAHLSCSRTFSHPPLSHVPFSVRPEDAYGAAAEDAAEAAVGGEGAPPVYL
jgi:hypothetical protein